MSARLCLDKLQSRTDSISCGIGSSSEKTVSHTHLDKHSSEIVSFEKSCLAFFLGHLALTELDHLIYHLFHSGISLRINDLCAADVKTLISRSSLDFVNISYEDNTHEPLCEKSCISFLNTSVCSFSEYDLLRFSFNLFNQFIEHFDSPVVSDEYYSRI